MNEKQIGKEAYRFASDRLATLNNQTKHYRAKLYGRLVLYFGGNGTNRAGTIKTYMTRYAILKALDKTFKPSAKTGKTTTLMKNKSRYMRILAELAQHDLVSLDSDGYLDIHTNLDLKPATPEHLSYLPEEAIRIFREMDRFFGKDDLAFYTRYAQFAYFYLRLYRCYEIDKASYISDQLENKFAQWIRAQEALLNLPDKEYCCGHLFDGTPDIILVSDLERQVMEYDDRIYEIHGDLISELEDLLSTHVLKGLGVINGGQPQGVSPSENGGQRKDNWGSAKEDSLED